MKDKVESNYIKQILKGDLIALIFTIVMLLIFSIVLTYTSVPEAVIPQTIIIITGISILLGSSVGTIKMRTRGLISGVLISIIYIGTIYFFSSVINGDFSFNIYSLIMSLSSIVCGIIGGIIGVNLDI